MKIWKSYTTGIKQAAQYPKMILVLWLFNFLLGLVIYFLACGFFCKVLGSSALAEGLQKKMDFNVLFEILAHQGEGLGTIREAALLLLGLSFLTSIFLNGGILHVFAAASRDSGLMTARNRFAQDFFQGAGKFFGRFFRLCIYSLLLWVTFILGFLFIHEILESFTAGGTNERLMVILFFLRVAVGLFFLFLIKMILDYTQIKIVLQDSRYVFRSFLQTMAFVLHNLGKTMALYYLLLLLGMGLLLLEWAVEAAIPMSSAVLIVLAFLVGQALIAGRCWLKTAFLAGQLDMYLSR